MQLPKKKRGDIYSIDMKFPGQSRPIPKLFVLLQDGDWSFVRPLKSISAVKMTTQYLDRLKPTDVFIPANQTYNNRATKIQCNFVYTFPIKRLKNFIFHLPDEIMKKVDRALIIGLGIIKLD